VDPPLGDAEALVREAAWRIVSERGTDGGVYDNLGLETAWKRYDTILVSNGGGTLPADAEPKRDWVRHAIRITEIIDSQVVSLRETAGRRVVPGARAIRRVLGNPNRHRQVRFCRGVTVSGGHRAASRGHADTTRTPRRPLQGRCSRRVRAASATQQRRRHTPGTKREPEFMRSLLLELETTRG
jgi:hypothetical protein